MTSVEVPLSDEQMASLERLAGERNVSVVELIQEGVNRVLRPPKKPLTDEQKRRAIAIAGQFRSGCGDLAERHDDYFAEASES
ncbi:MAG: CopG family transcriptional regulator [Planctomycetota bacterium]